MGQKQRMYKKWGDKKTINYTQENIDNTHKMFARGITM